MKRTIILILDSFGIGYAPDSDKYGDKGSDTLGHIVERCSKGTATGTVKRDINPLMLPNMGRLGLEKAAEASRGKPLAHTLGYKVNIEGAYGYCTEKSKGKDTQSGHWEMTGVPVMFDWGYFPKTIPCFPDKIINELIKRTNIPGILGNKHASGTEILDELGEEHIKTGKPIVYTSADSVFQIACHEKYFGLDRLYKISDIARKILNENSKECGCIGRVIARPFLGEMKGQFSRTGNRHDIAVKPPEPTLLDFLKKNGGEVISIGKIADIFADCGITKKIKATGLEELFSKTVDELKIAQNNTLIFTNFVDFDTIYGHRRDVTGYAWALEYIDSRLPELEKMLQPGDLVVIAADHGCDPTWKGTDHTRENIPILMFGPGVKTVALGGRTSFADIGQTIAKHLGLPKLKYGTACDIF